jgi:hypothetical protein
VPLSHQNRKIEGVEVASNHALASASAMFSTSIPPSCISSSYHSIFWQTKEAHVTFHAENNFGCDAKSNKCAI